MAIIGPDAKGRYALRWRDGSGKRHYVTLPKMPFKKVKQEHAKRLAAAANERVNDALTFRHLAADYLKIHGPEMAARAFIRAKGILENYALPAFGDEIVNDVNAAKRWPKIIRTWRNSRSASPATKNRELNVVRAVFYFAVANGDLDATPLPKGAVTSLQVEETTPVFFTPEEWARFIGGVTDLATWRRYLASRRRYGVVKITSTADKYRRNGAGLIPESDAADAYRERMLPWRGVWIALLESGGSRLSEVLELRWSQIDLRGGVAIIRQGKTGKPKVIPISEDWRADLESRTRGIGDALVYAQPDGSRYTDMQAIRAFAIWRDVAGLRRGLTIHKIRHTWASWATQAGAPDRQVQDGLGHADARMTKRYSHLKPEHLATAFAAVAAIKRSETVEKIGHGIGQQTVKQRDGDTV